MGLDNFERGWLLEQIDDVFKDDYDEELYEALVSAGLFSYDRWLEDDRARRAIGRFVGDLVVALRMGSEELGINMDDASLVLVAAGAACMLGLVAGKGVRSRNVNP